MATAIGSIRRSIRRNFKALPTVATLGDLAVFLLFPVLGSASHDEGLSATSVARVVVPFAVTWFGSASLTGTLEPPTLRSPRQTLWRVPLVWLPAGVGAIAVRTIVFGRPFSTSFALVAIGVTGAMLLAWRLALAIAKRS